MHDNDGGGGGPVVCRIGDHKHRDDTRICARHLHDLQSRLAGISRMAKQLPVRLVPDTGSATGDKVTASRVGSPTPGRLDVLNMLSPGGVEIRRDARMLAPQIRRWSTLSLYHVTVPDRHGRPVTRTRKLRTWHAEPVLDHDGRPLLVMPDDQIGSIPPAEWADMWVRRLRVALRHTASPIRGRVDLACDAQQRHRVDRARLGEALRAARGVPALMPAVAQLAALHAGYVGYLRVAAPRVRAALLGVRDDGPEHQARVAAALSGTTLLPDAAVSAPVHDPVAAEWAVRYGYAGVAAAVEVDARYLAGWLPLLADTTTDDPDLDVAVFARELRALHAELEHLVGESSDQQWLGRCPAFLRTVEGDDTDRLCGAGLWHDPYRSRIECPRCATAWPEADWMRLANLIRLRWPLDRRRCYTQADRVAAEAAVRRQADSSTRAYRCRGCEQVLTVEWVEITRRGELTRTFSPAGLVCPGGCLSGGTTVAA